MVTVARYGDDKTTMQETNILKLSILRKEQQIIGVMKSLCQPHKFFFWQNLFAREVGRVTTQWAFFVGWTIVDEEEWFLEL